jgi:uncharacterized spore protein YtfJ
MNVTDMLETAKDSITVRRVFGEPYEKDGVTIITAARVMGGGGGGSGGGTVAEGGQQEGEGGGFGVRGRPAGAYVLKDGHVRWEPAIDVNRIVAVVGVVAVAYLLSRPRPFRARRRTD